MARKCASAAILETLRDPRVVTLPAAAQALWIRVVTAMQASSISVLRFGSDIMNRTEIALFIQMAETEIETHMETLVGRGLLARDADGAIVCPMLVAAATRSEINRANGLRGGRPRKNAMPQGQTNLILPIDGGKMETKKTEMETKTGSESAETASTTTYLSKSKSIEVSSTVFHETAAKVLEVMQIDPARSYLDCGLVRQWLADGATPEMILDVVTRKTGPHVKTLKYFNAAMAEAIAVKPVATPQWEKKFNLDLQIWDATGRQGPAPRMADYREQAA